VNWFFVTFIAHDEKDDAELKREAGLSDKGAGLYVYVKVNDVDDFYKAALSKGLQPESEPQKRPSGNREFVLRDPDGYRLVFFQKK
jgi:uncharacterized glyoxalase superfamily protein PhnB